MFRKSLMCLQAAPLLRCAAFACLLGSAAASPAAITEPMIVTSSSKQFVVRGKAQTSVFAGRSDKLVYADPAITVMACERVRAALQEELGWGNRWRDPVFINIHPSSGNGEKPLIQAIAGGTKGWRYRIEMPDEASRRDFIQPLVHVLLLEYANRGAYDQSAELPPWLIEGMTEHMLTGPVAALALQPNTLVVRNKYSDEAGPVLRKRVQEKGALTVDQLTWPDFDERDAAALDAYRTSAHLFVRELLRLNGGAEAMAAMLALLPKQLNWQSAFLLAYERHFARMLDAEKWWSLVVVQTKMHERSTFWPAGESQIRLDEILYSPMQVRLKKDEMPHLAPVSLQTLVSEWSLREQVPILRNKIQQLLTFRLHVTPEFGALANDYRAVLERYLAERLSKKLAAKEPSSRQVKSAIRQAVDALSTLDERRAKVISGLAAAPKPPEEVPLTPH